MFYSYIFTFACLYYPLAKENSIFDRYSKHRIYYCRKSTPIPF